MYHVYLFWNFWTQLKESPSPSSVAKPLCGPSWNRLASLAPFVERELPSACTCSNAAPVAGAEELLSQAARLIKRKVVNCNGSWRNIGCGIWVATRRCQKRCCLEPDATFTRRLSVECLSIDRCLSWPYSVYSCQKHVHQVPRASYKVSCHPARLGKNPHLLLRDRVDAIIVEAIPMNSQMLVACNAEWFTDEFIHFWLHLSSLRLYL